MKEKILHAVNDMQSRIERDSEHIYRDKVTGLRLQGVSTVSSIVPKDWLTAYGAKEAMKALGYSDYENDVEKALEVWETIKDCESVQDFLKILKEAKSAHARKSKKAMVDGTKGHKILENFVNARITGENIPIVEIDSPFYRPYQQFLEWERKNMDYWIVKEALICRLDKSYAGQLDAIGVLKTGKLSLFDFKFANQISEDYLLQTGGYAAAFEPYGISFDQRVIIRLPKTLEKDEWDPNEFKYKKVPNDIEVVTPLTIYEADREAFFHALPVKGWINMVLEKGKNKSLFKKIN